MSIAGGFAQAALKTGQEFGCNAMQIFTKSPRSRFVKPIDPQDANEFKAYCAQYKIQHVVAHSSYLLNFGKPLAQVEWALKDILLDFERLHILGGHGVVVHIGKSLEGERAEAIKNVVENAKKIVDKTEHFSEKSSHGSLGMQYILENTAGQGTEIGFQLEELGQIWNALKGFSPRLKSCLDTAHIWAAGYDISTPAAVAKTLKTYDQLIGIKTLSCFHFNDSKKALASRVDRHENLGLGTIAIEGLAAIAQFAEQNSIPLILETPDGEIKATAKGRSHLDDIKIVREKFFK